MYNNVCMRIEQNSQLVAPTLSLNSCFTHRQSWIVDL